MRNALKIGVGVLAGIALGYAACKRQLEQSYMDRADAEIADMKAHYEKSLKQEIDKAIQEYDEWLASDVPNDRTQKGVATYLSGDVVTPIITADQVAAYFKSEPNSDSESDSTLEEMDYADVNSGPVPRTGTQLIQDEAAVLHDSAPYDEPPVVAAAAQALINYNQISTQHTRPAKPAAREKNVNDQEHPVVISEDEFMSGESGYEQVTLTYYTGDNVLCTPDDNEVAGNERLWAVGTLIENYVPPSGDSNVIYIRSPKLQQDYEIIRMEGRFSVEVLGLGDESQQPAS
jgi:hypothetical protein